MPNKNSPLTPYNNEFSKLYKKRKIILSFEDFIKLVSENPKGFMRDSSQYLADVFAHHKEKEIHHLDITKIKRFKLFDLSSERSQGIIGGEKVQNEIFDYLSKFKRKGFVDKLILLYGPNGSSKSSTVEKIAKGMENYSQEHEGAVYKFNWIFPLEIDGNQKKDNPRKKIGFGSDSSIQQLDTYAFLNEYQILTRIHSEFKENPLFLIPMPYREDFLRLIIAQAEKIPKEKVTVPPHLLSNGLSKKNQEILENMQNIYNGDMNKVYRHIQVERFFYSHQYRVGISSIDPQMSIDAHEKQITINRNYGKLPAYLQDINFHESYGELVEANRGLLEYSDFLSRPLGTIKYLLNTIERGFIKLPSGIAHLDLVYIATTNDKHVDAFKTTPEFNSFRSRFELITVPYLLRPSLEKMIYQKDLEALEKEVDICPHTIDLLAMWAVMTRLKPCDLSSFDQEVHQTLKNLNPLAKIKLYEGEPLQNTFGLLGEKQLLNIRSKIWKNSTEGLMYEGRFGASPRDIRAILHRSVQKAQDKNLTPMIIFEELKKFIKHKSIYDFLQYEPQGYFHNHKFFIEALENEYIKIFEEEIAQAMSIANKEEYRIFLERYIKNVVAYLKNEDIWNPTTNSFEKPSEEIMSNVEKILKVESNVEEYRSDLLNKIAAKKIENPSREIKIDVLFKAQLDKIKNHFFLEQRRVIETNYASMLNSINSDEKNNDLKQQEKQAQITYKNMNTEYGYSKQAVYQSIQFIMKNGTSQKGSSSKKM